LLWQQKRRNAASAEGLTQDEAIIALRNRQKRNMLATLLFSQGTPMMLGGDEFGRTQQGNNNAHCQDSDISWFDWRLGEDANALLTYTKRLVELRKSYPTLRRSRFLTGQLDEALGVKDVTWINANGEEMQDSNWKDASMKCFGMLLDGRAQKTGIKRRGEDKTVLMVMNSFEDVVEFTLPKSEAVEAWSLLIDTNVPDADAEQTFKPGSVYQVTGRSLLLFAVNAAKA
jgi:isoamylase